MSTARTDDGIVTDLDDCPSWDEAIIRGAVNLALGLIARRTAEVERLKSALKVAEDDSDAHAVFIKALQIRGLLSGLPPWLEDHQVELATFHDVAVAGRVTP